MPFLRDKVWEHHMRNYLVACVIVAVVAGIVLVVWRQPVRESLTQNQQPTNTAKSSTETLPGTFWIDRWRQGRFAPHRNFVDEAIFDRLRDYEGIPILVQGAVDQPEYYSGPTCLKDFDRIERLPQSVSIRLRWITTDKKPLTEPILRTRNLHDVSFEVQLTNMENVELILTSGDFVFSRQVRHPRNQTSYGTRPGVRQRGVLRYSGSGCEMPPQDSKYTLNWMKLTPEQPLEVIHDIRVPVKAGATFSWNVTISDWEPNEYELMVQYLRFDNPAHRDGSYQYLYSNALSLDVLSDEPRRDDVVEMHVRQRDKTDLKSGQPVPLEIVFHNCSDKELLFPFWKGTTDDLDLSDMLFCYGSDGRLLPITSKVAGPMEIRIPVNESFTLPVDAPEGTVVARAVFYNNKFSPKIGSDDPERFTHGWHWSQHWQHPSVREQLP